MGGRLGSWKDEDGGRGGKGGAQLSRTFFLASSSSLCRWKGVFFWTTCAWMT